MAIQRHHVQNLFNWKLMQVLKPLRFTMKVRDNERRTVVQKKQSVADCRMQAIQTKRNDMTRRCLENQTRSLTVV